MEEFEFTSKLPRSKTDDPPSHDFFGLGGLGKRSSTIPTSNTRNSKKSLKQEEILIDDEDEGPIQFKQQEPYIKKLEPEDVKKEKEFPNKIQYQFGRRDTEKDWNNHIIIEEEGEGENTMKTDNTVLLDEQTFMLIEEGNSQEEKVEEILEYNEKDFLPMPAERMEEETATKDNTVQNERPILWLNKLKFYPSYLNLENTISFRELLFEDLLQGNPDHPVRTLESAFLTTYGYDFELLEPLLKGGVKITLVNDWNDSSQQRVERNVNGYSNFTLVRPNKDLTRPYMGVFHAKLWLLKFPKFLRIVIGSGNLCLPQWVSWSNCLWFRDFPIRTEAIGNSEYQKENFDLNEDFVKTLEDFIIKIIPKWINLNDLLGFSLEDYYFSDIDIALIPSIPGRHYGKYFDKYGHRRIAAILRKTMRSRLNKKGNLVVTYQTTSLSSLDEKFLSEFLSSIMPGYISIEDLTNKKNTKGSDDPIYKRVKLIYPTKEYVEESKDGSVCARPLKLTPQGYEKDGFPKEILHQFENPEEGDFHKGLIPHLKVFIVTEESGEIDDDTIIYFGSHNFSPAAWGRYERDYTQISIGNTELGVLLPPKKGSRARKERLVKSLSFKFPPKPYGRDQVPWISKIHLNQK